ncbi:CHAP domain-containing protein [bacterium]|nr:CHAP domain-containing protein [bacterium]
MIHLIAQASRVYEGYRTSPTAVVPTSESQGDRFEFSQHVPDLALSWRGRVPVAQAQPDQLSARQQRFDSGLEAADWGVSQRQRNPNNDSYDWSNYSLGWARRGLEQVIGRDINWLHAPDSQAAMRQARKAGKLHRGKPPAGSLVFVKDGQGHYKVGFANKDGKTFRTTVSAQENPGTIGDRPLPEGKVCWAMPPASRHSRSVQATENDPKPKDSGKGSGVGLKARSWGYTKAKINPNIDRSASRKHRTSWGGYCLGWVRRAVEHAAGRSIPWLHAEGANDAYARLRKQGKMHYGNPPAGAIVFWDQTNSKLGAKYGHVAIVNPGGRGYRGTSSDDFADHHHIGDRKFSARERKHIGWVLPEDLY